MKHVNNTTLDANEDVALINNSLHCLFSSITVVVDQDQNTLIYNDYPFLSVLQLADKTQVIDQFHNMTGYLPYVRNTCGHAARKTMAAGSSNIHLMGHLW